MADDLCRVDRNEIRIVSLRNQVDRLTTELKAREEEIDTIMREFGRNSANIEDPVDVARLVYRELRWLRDSQVHQVEKISSQDATITTLRQALEPFASWGRGDKSVVRASDYTHAAQLLSSTSPVEDLPPQTKNLFAGSSECKD